MISELSFLLEILLEHKLEKETQTAIRDRIKEIESGPRPVFTPANSGVQVSRDPHAQAPSILAKYPELGIHPETIAQTPAAAKALADRQAMIAEAMSGKPPPGQTGPRKLGRS